MSSEIQPQVIFQRRPPREHIEPPIIPYVPDEGGCLLKVTYGQISNDDVKFLRPLGYIPFHGGLLVI